MVRGAEYSAAVSRLADSVRSCSECGMRGRKGQEEPAPTGERRMGKKKLRTSARMRKLCTFLFFPFFWGWGGRRARVQECKSLCTCKKSFPSRLEEGGGRGGIKREKEEKKKVERPTSEENSIAGCSDAVINHPAEMSNAVIL